MSGHGYDDEIAEQVRRVVRRNQTLRRFAELDAGDVILDNQRRLVQEAVDVLTATCAAREAEEGIVSVADEDVPGRGRASDG
jgi:DNA-directed RNA polymerase beta' subunit